MPVHITKAPNVHENVEPESCACMKGSQSFVMTAAMAKTQFDNLGDARLGETGDQVPNLAVGVMRGGVKQRRSKFDFKGFSALDQVDQRGFCDGLVREDLGRGLREFRLGLKQIVIRLRVLNQRRSGSNFAG